MPRALLSVHDKTGLVAFARALLELGFELVASGGTARALIDAGLAVTPVEALTGFPELLGGRVKTLHPAVHAGILSRRSDADRTELEARGLGDIDLVAVTLYPFAAALARGASEADLIEEIDIGGVTLLRAAAKNHAHVTVVADPARYDQVLHALRAGDLAALRRRLAAEAFALTAAYDQAIAAWLGASSAEAAPLRYGENPHQSASFTPGPDGLPYRQLGGKELSYNNLLDLDAAWSAVAGALTGPPRVCIVKHGSPCGLALDASLSDAWHHALASDPISAFGGVVTTNREVDVALVHAIGDLFIEVLAAPSFSDEARALLVAKKKNCRLLAMAPFAAPMNTRSVLGGRLTQSADDAAVTPEAWRHVAGPAADSELMAVLAFAFEVVRYVKSNAIVLAQKTSSGFTTVGIGGGQTNRIDAVQQAISRAGGRAGGRAAGAVLASDAFFPFPDGVLAAADAHIRAVVEPGGALKDADVIAAADLRGVTLVFTGRRHFRH